jgi:Kef-type K+ transport system membrane component KefB/nucleotide-binding universal stress UspA family protein
MGPFTAAPHHDVFMLLLQVAVLLLAARAMGEAAQRLGQPAVVGEILAGIVLGPSLLSGLFPLFGEWIVPQTDVQGYLLEVVSMIGAMFLLLITGLETDLALIRRHARTAIGVSGGGILVTFATGFLLGSYLPEFLVAPGGDRLIFALFVATAMSISAIPVIAKVLMDMNLMRRDVGQTIIAAGMSDDTIGWILLSIVAGLAAGEAVTIGSVFQAVGSVLAFLLLSFTAGRLLVKKLLDYVQDEVSSPDRMVTLVVVLTFLWGAITQALNLEAVLGAFVMGVIFGQMPRLPEAVHKKLITVSLGIFTPIFFAVAGLKVNIGQLLTPQLIGITLVVIFIATAGKVVGTYAGARLVGRREHWTALSFGAGLNARGAMEIIIATIGLQLGILTQDMFSIIVIMAMSTSLMAPPALRWVLRRVVPEEQELRRLRQEELAVGSVVAKVHRVLVPVRRREREDAVHSIEAHVLDRLRRKSPLSVTLFNVTDPGDRASSVEFLDRLAEGFPDVELVKKVVEARDPGRAILDEAAKYYDLIILGATEQRPGASALFNPIVDNTIRMAPCPTMVVKGEVLDGNWPPRRILVPTNGSLAARHAAEVAFALASEGEEVIVLNVIEEQASPYRYASGPEAADLRQQTARQIVHELQQLGEAQGTQVAGRVEVGPSPEDAILDLADTEPADLIVMGTDVRPGSERLFLGPRVERILEQAPCPVLVVNVS